MNFDERVEDLEKDNKRLRRLVIAAISIALAALIGGTVVGVGAYTRHINPDSITTKNITLKDNNGIIRVMLIGSNGSLYLRDTNGKLRVALSGNNGSLYLKDSNRIFRVELSGILGTVKTYKPNGNLLHELGKVPVSSNLQGKKHTHLDPKHSHTGNINSTATFK